MFLTGPSLRLIVLYGFIVPYLFTVKGVARLDANQEVKNLHNTVKTHDHPEKPEASKQRLTSEVAKLLRRQSNSPSGSSGQTGGGSSASATSGDFTCSPSKKCGNGACCGKDGWCGYGPTYCGAGCQSSCDAKAECGRYASSPGASCPLNVCCSQYGFCGTTREFCDIKCQSHCNQPKPSGAKSNVQKKVIAYYEGWSDTHACGVMEPEEIPVKSLTHLNFAFGYINPGDFKITNLNGVSPAKFKRITQLKQKNRNLKVMIALGGWTFNDPGRWQPVFPSIAANVANRKTFIKNLLGFLSEYGFDGVDFDWEYPGAEDRGGSRDDGIHFTALLKDVRSAFQADSHKYLLTFTAPTSYWYLRHFDIAAMTKQVDWINVMSYDLHGVWDRDNPIGNHVLAHTNLTEIDLALDLFWRNNINPSKIVLGVGFYGRSFKLSNPSCWKPGCSFSGPGDRGPCTKAEGILSYKEIADILMTTKAKPHYDNNAEVNYIVYGQNNWISFDNEKSLKKKIDFANDRGLDGLMIWAVDLDNSKGDLLKALTGIDSKEIDTVDLLSFDLDPGPSVEHSTNDLSRCVVTDCNTDGRTSCPSGFTPLTRTNVKDGKRCSTGKNNQARFVCCPTFASPKPEDCHWADQRSRATKYDCNGKCDIGEINVVGDSFGWTGGLYDGKYGDRCGRGGKVFCCKAGNMRRYLDICTWTRCNEDCPKEKPHLFTTDSGGPKSNSRCSSPPGGTILDLDPIPGRRKFCCPQKDSFRNCSWRSKKVCSTSCDNNQLTLDTDPKGPGGRSCDNGREQAYCCDPPGGTGRPFTPFDLENLFPVEYLPAADAEPQYDLISFDGFVNLEIEDPNRSGLAFFLLAGSSTALSSMKKRDTNNGMEFLDCPQDIFKKSMDQRHVARVICLGEHKDCFGIRKGGVAGTIVKMPSECGGSTFARAISLELSRNKTVPLDIVKRNPTSAVFDFAFDYNIALARRDAGRYSLRMDYSNVAGYWDAVVNSSGIKKRSLRSLVDRFFGNRHQDWFEKFHSLKLNTKQANKLNEALTSLVFDEGKTCDSEGGGIIGESVSVGVGGQFTTDSFYGFSMIATWDPSSAVDVHEAAGFYRAEGRSNVVFKVGGRGSLDSSKKFGGETFSKVIHRRSTGGHTLFHGWAFFDQYFERGVKLQTKGGKNGAIEFDGYMEAGMISEFGKMTINFPETNIMAPSVGGGEGQRPEDTIRKDKNILVPTGDIPSGAITVFSTTQLGLEVGLFFSSPFSAATPNPFPDMSVYQETFATFRIGGTEEQVCLTTSLGTRIQSRLANGAYVGWPSSYQKNFVSELAQAGDRECFDKTASTVKRKLKNRRKNGSLPELSPEIPSVTVNLRGPQYSNEIRAIPCGACLGCFQLDYTIRPPCCGCSWLRPDNYLDDESIGDSDGFGSIPLPSIPGFSPPEKRDTAEQLMTSPVIFPGRPGGFGSKEVEKFANPVAKREVEPANPEPMNMFSLNPLIVRAIPAVGTGRKEAAICDHKIKSEKYPQYPDFTNPNNLRNFDASRYSSVPKYYHNATADCGDWDVTQAPTWDTVFVDPRTLLPTHLGFHQTYNTEHVLEAQTIARFFTNWLPLRATRANQRNCFWVGTYVVLANHYWGTDGSGDFYSFARVLMNELGSINHLDRLTVFLARSNGHKGRLFSGAVAVSSAKYDNLTSDDLQFMVLREVGMIFTYLNRAEVWDSFCSTYNGILDRLEEFDTYYNNKLNDQNQLGADSHLAVEWPKHVRAELDMVVKGALTNIEMFNSRKKAVNPVWLSRWSRALTGLGLPPGGKQLQKIALNRIGKCRNLPPA